MSKQTVVGLVMVLALAPVVWAEGEHAHDHGASQEAAAPAQGEQQVTGEVVDTMCYIGHGESGAGHASCAKKCIEAGLPVAIKSGGQLYLAAMPDHTPANAQLAQYAGKQVTVTGTVSERDGQKLITIKKIQPAI